MPKRQNRVQSNGRIPLLSVLLIIACVASACQPTPEDLIVQNKKDSELMDKIGTDNGAEHNGTPQVGIAEYVSVDHLNFSDELTNGLILNTDAYVLIPDVDRYPIVNFKRKQFMDDHLDTVLDTLLDGKTLYKARDRHALTKSEIEERIVETNFAYKDLDSPMATAKGITDLDELHRQRDAILQELNARLQTAPESIPLVVHDRSLFENNLRGTVYENDVRLMDITITNNSSDTNLLGVSLSIFGEEDWSYIRKIHRAINGRDIPDDLAFIPVDSMPEGMGMSPEEAIALAEETFTDMGAGDDIEVSDIHYLEIPQEGIKCYALQLLRYINGVPIISMSTNPRGATKRSDDTYSDAFSIPVPMETMSVLISDDGIIDLSWQDPIELLETVNQNVELVPSEKIVDVFRQEFKNAYSDKSIAEITKTYDCYNVSLTYGMARIPNRQKTFMAIPLWDFYAKWESSWESGGRTGKDTIDASIITINAVDNSRFVRNWGY